MEPTGIRLVHWYDTQLHRIACGAPGQMHSTKHVRAVTCTMCLQAARKEELLEDEAVPASYIN